MVSKFIHTLPCDCVLRARGGIHPLHSRPPGIASGICNLAFGAGDDRRRPSTQAQPNSPNANTAPTAPSEEFAYSNAGTQNIKGLTNQTGYVKGNANGALNFGSLITAETRLSLMARGFPY